MLHSARAAASALLALLLHGSVGALDLDKATCPSGCIRTVYCQDGKVWDKSTCQGGFDGKRDPEEACDTYEKVFNTECDVGIACCAEDCDLCRECASFSNPLPPPCGVSEKAAVQEIRQEQGFV